MPEGSTMAMAEGSNKTQEMPEEIYTERLHLRKVGEGDLPLFREIYSDPEMMSYLGPPLTDDAILKRAREHAENWGRYGLGNYVLETLNGGVVIGYVGFGDPANHDFGWMIKPAWQRQGYAAESVRAIFDAVAGHYISQNRKPMEIIMHPDNEASVKIAQKLGAEFSGTVSYRGQDFLRYTRPMPGTPAPTQVPLLSGIPAQVPG